MKLNNSTNRKVVHTLMIGGGSASLAAANYLLDNNFRDFIILEKGNRLTKRVCPGEKDHTCIFCKKGCSTIEGVGGANAMNGNKICYFPASNHVARINENLHDSSLAYLCKAFSPYIDTSHIFQESPVINEKRYDADVFNKSQFGDWLGLMIKKVETLNKLTYNCEVTDVSRHGGNKFLVTSNTGVIYECQNIVFATGRSSYRFTRRLFDKLGINYQDQPQDIGIRVEARKEFFSEKYYYQVDPKFKYTFEELGKGRTFCAHNQGKIVPVQFGSSFFADGAFGESFTGENNIALMTRTFNYLENSVLEKWCEAINDHSANCLFLKEVMCENTSSDKMVNMVMDAVPFWPTAKHADIMRLLLNKLIVEEELLFTKEFLAKGSLKIYAPAIDLYWPVVDITPQFSSKQDSNIYVIGDAAGISRGFFQAAYAGVSWAQILLSSSLQNKSKSQHEIWSSWVPTCI